MHVLYSLFNLVKKVKYGINIHTMHIYYIILKHTKSATVIAQSKIIIMSHVNLKLKN